MHYIFMLLTAIADPGSGALPGNFLEAAPGIYSGAQPSPAQFPALHEMGIKTIVSVDGARPDIEAAKAAGLRYIHIPIGYDDITAEEAASMAKTLKEVEGPFFIHCHHGKHRSPAMSALAMRLLDPKVTPEEATAFMTKAGTSKEYDGLWRCVREFDPASITDLSPELHEVTPASSLVEEMVNIDFHYDHLLQFDKNAWKPLSDAPDLSPAHEAKLLHERIVALSAVEAAKPEDYRAILSSSADTASKLQAALEASDLAAATATLAFLKEDCRRCHIKYRN